jgi:hypothetical protein
MRAKVLLTSYEKSIPGKYHPILAIFHQPADAVLGMTRSVQRSYRDILTNFESLPVTRRASHCVTLFSTDDRKVAELRELVRGQRTAPNERLLSAHNLGVSTSMVPMTGIHLSDIWTSFSGFLLVRINYRR